MHTEIESAVNFLVNEFSQRLGNISENNCDLLKQRLTELLAKRFQNHWYPSKPLKGSAYRCINISIDDGSVDSVLLKAVEEVGITKSNLVSVFSKGLALWIDPNDVSCRLGKGAIFPISRKIDQKATVPVSTGPITSQRRPQQRPRSISPPLASNQFNYQQQRPRSITPPGFTSADAGQMYQSIQVKKNNSLDNIHKLWDTIPNTTSYTQPSIQSSVYQAPVSTLSRQYGRQQNDTVYSFNQYSSYYNPSSMRKKQNYNAGYNKQPKTMWQDDETYYKYHWSRNERSTPAVNSYSQSAMSYGYSFGRHAQEVC